MSPPPSKDLPLHPAFRFLSAGMAACIAETLSIPMDTAKVRLQLQASAGSAGAGGVAAAAPKYRGLLHTVRTMAVEEGASSLFKGLTPGLLRQCVFATLRIGLYEPVRNFYHSGDPSEIPLYKKIAAGMTTGTIGIAVANPTDVVKVRMQAEGRLAPGVARRYNGTAHAFATIYRVEGIRGLWTGAIPNMMRNSTITAAELATYDEVKVLALRSGLPDNIGTHLLCGTTAGFVATVVGSPVDVLKTRLMSAKPGEYNGAIDCIVKTAKNEGIAGFYKGFVPNFARIGSWNVFMFLAFEQLKTSFAGIGVASKEEKKD